MSKQYLYIFTRKDLDPVQIAVQSIHSAFEAGRLYTEGEHPSVVFISAKNETELLNFKTYFIRLGLAFAEFVEPHYSHSLTSIAVEPLGEDQRHLFKRFKLLTNNTFRSKL